MQISTVGVIGAGTMGNGIAHVFARSGHPVLLADVSESALTAGLATIRKNLAREVAKGKLTQGESEAAESRITSTTSLESLSSASLVIEAATERFEIKSKIFQQLDQVLRGRLGDRRGALRVPFRQGLEQLPGRTSVAEAHLAPQRGEVADDRLARPGTERVLMLDNLIPHDISELI